jgi:hypothetical protein
VPLEGHWERQHSSRASDTARERRVMLAVAMVLLAIVIAVGVASLTSRAQRSASGCIDMTIASTTGGATLHACGLQAARVCRGEVPVPRASAGELRRRCREAGLAAAG